MSNDALSEIERRTTAEPVRKKPVSRYRLKIISAKGGYYLAVNRPPMIVHIYRARFFDPNNGRKRPGNPMRCCVRRASALTSSDRAPSSCALLLVRCQRRSPWVEPCTDQYTVPHRSL